MKSRVYAAPVILVLTLLLGFSTNGQAQVIYQWSAAFGGDGFDEGKRTVVDTFGNVFVAGSFYGTADLDPGAGVDSHTSTDGFPDLFVSKFSSSGVRSWTRVIAGADEEQLAGIGVDSNGNIYLSGYFYGDVDFDPSGADDTHSAPLGSKVYLTKFLANGDYGWTKSFGDDDAILPQNLAVTSGGDLYLTGSFYASEDFDPGVGSSSPALVGNTDAFLAKYDSSGAFVWVKTFGATASVAGGTAVAIDGSNNVWVGGIFSGSIDLNAGAGTLTRTAAGTGTEDLFLAKYSSAGVFDTGTSIGGTGSEQLQGLAANGGSVVYAVGSFEGMADFNGSASAANRTAIGGRDGFVAAYTATAGFSWVKVFGSSANDALLSLGFSNEGDLLAAGLFRNQIDLDPGTGTHNVTSAGDSDAFLVCLSTAGVYQWNHVIGGTGADLANGAVGLSSGSAVLVGTFSGTIDFDSGAGTTNHTSAGVMDIFLTGVTVNPDLDGDGLTNDQEEALGTNPNNPDSDSDGVNDGIEVTNGTGPLDSDSDDDGLNDGQESVQGTNPLDSDSDDDGVNDGTEVTNTTGPLDSDSDDDGLTDGQEATIGSNPKDSDSDDDGLGDSQETSLGTNPSDSDSDDDSIGDSQEVTAGTNPNDSDSDDDSLTDGQESTSGTNPNDPDSDDDGVSDGQEITDGSNALDSGSFALRLGSSVCSEWNGFLGGMYNVMEHVNLSSSTIKFATKLYSLTGAQQGSQNFSVKAGAQTDLLAHDMQGFTADQYGLVCSQLTSGSASSFDGRMVYYKPGADGDYQFAFSMPFSKGLSGRQTVPFNSLQPSLNAADQDDLVANWLQITNLDSKKRSGKLAFYDEQGVELDSQTITLKAGARVDFSAHQFEKRGVGLAEWVPDSTTAKFVLRNVRYYYDNPGTADSFVSALQVEGRKGSGEQLVLPLDTSEGSAVVEVANALATTVKATVYFYDNTGKLVKKTSRSLAGHSSWHLVADTLLAGKKGIAIVDGNVTGGLISVAMHYQREADLGLKTVSAIEGRQALGTTLKGSYNTFLGQGCRLWLANGSSSDVTASVQMKRFNGEEPRPAEDVAVKGHGMVSYDLCAEDSTVTLGVVTLSFSQANSLVGTVVRIGDGDAYRFTTPVR